MSRPCKEADRSTYTGKVAAAIRAMRLKRGLSVAQVAARAEVPAKTWYHWEAGEALPLARLPAIAAALGCAPAKLLPK